MLKLIFIAVQVRYVLFNNLLSNEMPVPGYSEGESRLSLLGERQDNASDPLWLRIGADDPQLVRWYPLNRADVMTSSRFAAWRPDIIQRPGCMLRLQTEG